MIRLSGGVKVSGDGGRSGEGAGVQAEGGAAGGEGGGAGGVAADDGDPAQGADLAGGEDVAPGLRAGAEEDQVTRVGGCQVADGQGGDGRSAQGGEGDAVQSGQRSQGVAVVQEVDALDAGQPAGKVAGRDGGRLDAGVAPEGGGHEQELPGGQADDGPLRGLLGVETGAERVLQAMPSISGNTPAAVTPATRARNAVPTMLSCRSGPRSPSSCSRASRAAVPDPHGDRSTSPSAKTVTFRWRAAPSSSSWKITPYTPDSRSSPGCRAAG